MLSPNTILQGRYRVVRKLGEGGMGAVYEAIDQRVSCIVALKETLATHDGEAREAFEREASLLANLRHSGLPKVTDYFSENEGAFLVMEFIPGNDLAELLDLHGGPFSQAKVLRWADDLLGVLEYLHGQQPPILHRDIKPSNLKVTKEGEVFLLDFGLAKGSLGQMPTLVTGRSVRGYTPVYASLEQILGQGTDPRSDIYSLGATLYHLLAGVAPIDAPTRYHAIEEERDDPLPLIESINPQASPGVTAVIHQALWIGRKQRHASAAEMRRALRNAAAEDGAQAASEEDEIGKHKEAERQEEERLQLEEELVRRRAEDEASRRAEAERLRLETEAQRNAQEDVTRTRAAEDAAERVAEERARAQKTLPAPPPRPFSFTRRTDGSSEAAETTSTIPGRRKRAMIIAAVVLAMLVGGFLLVRRLSRDVPQTASVDQSRAVASTPTPAAASPSSTPTPSPSPSATPIVPTLVPAPADFARLVKDDPAYGPPIVVREVDLNGDGRSELVAQYYHPCGSGGCTTQIFRRSGGGFTDISGNVAEYMWPDLKSSSLTAGPNSTSGYLDLKYGRQFFRFNGREYSCYRNC
ncbi:MAG: protein kinase [Pyrinomonadaceae bacterium]